MRLFVSAILLCTFLSSHSQSRKKYADPSEYFDKMQKDVVTFNPKPCSDCNPFPFSNIKVIDKRYDTSSFGYMLDYKMSRKDCKLVTANGLETDLETYLNTIFKNKFVSNGSSLVIVLRKFRFYGNYSDDNKPLSKSNKTDYFLQAGIDCFLLSDSLYIPLIRKDSAMPVYGALKDAERGTSIVSSLKMLLKSLPIDSAISQIANRKKLNYQELNEYYDKKFKYPVIEDCELKKGVYMSFNEFRNNAPSYVNFDVVKSKIADDIYLIKGQDTALTRDAWGYCDSKNIYIKAGIRLFVLNKQVKGFSFMGFKKLNHKYYGGFSVPNNPENYDAADLITVGLALLFPPRDKFIPNTVPLYLDMESGEVN